MKLPVQAAAVLRDRPTGPIGRSSRSGGTMSAVEPSDCKTCKRGPNPCKGGAPNLCECSSGTCQCCRTNSCSTAAGGRCVCN